MASWRRQEICISSCTAWSSRRGAEFNESELTVRYPSGSTPYAPSATTSRSRRCQHLSVTQCFGGNPREEAMGKKHGGGGRRSGARWSQGSGPARPMVWIGRNSASGISRHSTWQSAGGKNISEDIGMTKVLALIGPQVATSVAADVAALPFPRHAQQIVGIHHAEIAVHEVDDEIVHGRKAQRLMPVCLEQFRAPTHHCPHFGVAQHTFPCIRRRCIEPLVETGV